MIGKDPFEAAPFLTYSCDAPLSNCTIETRLCCIFHLCLSHVFAFFPQNRTLAYIISLRIVVNIK